MKHIEINIMGMSCQHCVKAVEIELSNLPISDLQVSIGKASFKYDETKMNESKISESIDEAGFKIV